MTIGVKSFQGLVAWQKAMELTEIVYSLTRKFPSEERFGLVSQMRRAAVSVPSNIAEGQARNTKGEFVQFLGHARGSLAELRTQLLLAERLGYAAESDALTCMTLVEECSRLLTGLVRSLTTDH